MAELIDKSSLVSLVNREKEMSSSEYSVGYHNSNKTITLMYLPEDTSIEEE